MTFEEYEAIRNDPDGEVAKSFRRRQRWSDLKRWISKKTRIEIVLPEINVVMFARKDYAGATALLSEIAKMAADFKLHLPPTVVHLNSEPNLSDVIRESRNQLFHLRREILKREDERNTSSLLGAELVKTTQAIQKEISEGWTAR